MKKLINHNVLYIVLGYFWIFFGFNAAQQYLLVSFALMNKQQNAIFALLILYTTFLISGIFSSKIIAKLGLKKSVILGALTYTVFIFSLISKNFNLIYFASVLIGLGAGLLWISSGQIISENSSHSNLGRNLGLQYASFILGTLFGTAFGALLLNRLNFNQLYFCFGLVSLLAIPLLFNLRLKPSPVLMTKFNLLFIFNKKLLLISPIVFASAYILNQTFTSMNLVILNLFNLKTVGIIASILRLTMVISVLVLGTLSDSINKVRLLAFLGICGITGTVFFLYSTQLISVLFSIIFLGIFVSATYPICLALFKEHSRKRDYIYSISAFQIYNNVAVLISLGSTAYLPIKESFIPGLTMLIISIPLLGWFSKAYVKKSH